MRNFIILLLINLISVLNVFSQITIDGKNLFESAVNLNFDPNKDNKTPKGSGFFIGDYTNGGFIYLVTAKHVLFKNDTTEGLKLLGEKLYITYRDDIYSDEFNKISLDIKNMYSNNLILFSDDIAICLVGKLENNTISYLKTADKKNIQFNDKVNLIFNDRIGLCRFDDVKISNDIYIIGYPSSLEIPNNPQFDFYKPLVKKGAVAGIYKTKKYIILDGSSFGGNSGGPVFCFFPEEKKLKLIGVVIQYIPTVNELYVNNSKTSNTFVPTNSGYSVALSSDLIIELLDKFNVIINASKK